MREITVGLAVVALGLSIAGLVVSIRSIKKDNRYEKEKFSQEGTEL